MMSKKQQQADEQSVCGYVAIVGRPNVGKSTLLNQILGQKISITARKPQTTRRRILGIKTTDNAQFLYLDTPGYHQDQPQLINRYMNRTVKQGLADADVILFMVSELTWKDEDDALLAMIKQSKVPVMLAVNKVDQISDKKELLPHIKILAKKADFADIIPISAKNGDQVAALEQRIAQDLPEQDHFYSADQITDCSERFLASELIREKLTRLLGQELPYALAVTIEAFEEADKLYKISAVIWVDKASQKAIVIGKGGGVLREVGEKARLDMERLFGEKVFLKLWVKVKKGWADDDRILRELGMS